MPSSKQAKKTKKQSKVEARCDEITTNFIRDTLRVEHEENDEILVTILGQTMNLGRGCMNPPVIEKFKWKVTSEVEIQEIEKGFGIKHESESPASENYQPWPPASMMPMDLSSDAVKMLQRSRKYKAWSQMDRGFTIHNVLLAVLDEVMEAEARDTRSLDLQLKTSFESNLANKQRVKQKFHESSHNTLWCGDKREPGKVINLIMVEKRDVAFSDHEALSYMACVHQERIRLGRKATVYGITTNGNEWRFIRISEDSEWACHVEFYGKGGTTGYQRIATLLGFIMREVISPSPFVTNNQEST